MGHDSFIFFSVGFLDEIFIGWKSDLKEEKSLWVVMRVAEWSFLPFGTRRILAEMAGIRMTRRILQEMLGSYTQYLSGNLPIPLMGSYSFFPECNGIGGKSPEKSDGIRSSIRCPYSVDFRAGYVESPVEFRSGIRSLSGVIPWRWIWKDPVGGIP